MNPSNVLITGCSFSAHSRNQTGWLPEHRYKHYHAIIEQKLDCKILNEAVGGCSNFEIFSRTIDFCLQNNEIDFCIVQWSSLHRLWLYEAINNIDDFTIINNSTIAGKVSNMQNAKQLHKLLFDYHNSYMELKHWLILQNSLQNFFKNQKIDYVFIRGFDNYVSDIKMLVDQLPFNCIPDVDIPESIKKILNFNDNPDDYLFKKLMNIVNLYKTIDENNCIGYNYSKNAYGLEFDFRDIKDLADDNCHPGQITNSMVADSILDYIGNKF